MNVLRRLPIRRKISALILLTTGCTLILAFTADVGLSYFGEEDEVQQELGVLAQVLAQNAAAGLLFEEPESSRQILSSLRVNPAIVGAAVYANDGSLFVGYQNVPSGRLSIMQAGSRDRSHLVESFCPIELRGERLGTLYVASNRHPLETAMDLQITISVSVVIVSMLVALVMAAGLRRLVTRPFIVLAAAAQRVIREKHYAVRVDVTGLAEGDELHRVTLAFNEMLALIESRDEILRLHQADLERQVEVRTAELRAAMEESAALSRHNEMLLNAAGEGIFGLDTEGTVTFLNPSASRMLACDPADLIATKLHRRIHVSQGSTDCPMCTASVDVPVRTGSDALLRCADGRQLPVEYTSSTILDDDGQPTGVVVMFRDITERLVVERMKDEFVSTVSHELRTPLTSIRGALGLLGSGMLGSASPKGQRMLDIALANTDRLGRLINDILDLEKMSAGKVELHRRNISADDLVKQAVDVIQPIAERANVRILVEACSAPLFVDVDRILQVLINLLSNAVKFSYPETIIAVTARIAGNECVFSIRDEGRGVPVDKLETIFQRFKQVDASDSRDKGGTGLGLAICRSIAEAHGGRIWAERGAPRGSIFNFTVPLPHAERPALPNEATLLTAWTPAASREQVDVLLVEDDHDLARVVIAALESEGINIVHAPDGREALEQLRRVLPSLIILDLVLPELDGYAVVDWIRRNTNLRNVPLLVYSAQEVQTAAEQQRLTLGPTEFLTKSRVSLEEFQQRVTRLLTVVTKGIACVA